VDCRNFDIFIVISNIN